MDNQALPSGPRGAGAIMYSTLATTGWRFPVTPIVEADEKYLFDLEVSCCSSHVNQFHDLIHRLVEGENETAARSELKGASKRRGRLSWQRDSSPSGNRARSPRHAELSVHIRRLRYVSSPCNAAMTMHLLMLRWVCLQRLIP